MTIIAVIDAERLEYMFVDRYCGMEAVILILLLRHATTMNPRHQGPPPRFSSSFRRQNYVIGVSRDWLILDLRRSCSFK